MKTFYITTPLYYVNDVPHIGHAYTTIAADILSRWKRLAGEDVFFLTGTDEHGEKIAVAAAAVGKTPFDFVQQVAGSFKELWTVLGITNNDFIQTTDDRHKRVVQAVFEKLKASGDIYKGTYEDWYCLHDESYFSENELVNKKCPSCGRDVQKLKEESYFFRLSKYEQALLDHFAAHPDFLSPRNRASEIVNFVKSGLKDLSVSRTRVKWGVPVLSDPSHVVYVWFDALLNYVSALGYNPDGASGEKFSKCWPADVHLVGKEIFRFHTVIWPAMLMALGVPLPTKVFAHGWWTVDGTKMSKSLGNVVDPHKMSADYGVDAFRYFLFREVPFGADGDFSEKALLGRYNSELANNLGNLLQRTTTILLKNLEGEIPSLSRPNTLIGDASRFIQEAGEKYKALAFHDVLDQIYSLMMKTNKFIDDAAPWKLGPDKKEELSGVLFECLGVLKIVAMTISPFMPAKSGEIWNRLGENGEIAEASRRLLNGKNAFVEFQKGQRVLKGEPLFMRKGAK